MTEKKTEKEPHVALPDGRDIDPSALTTQMVWREIQLLKELNANEINFVKAEIKAAHEDQVRVPTLLQTAVGNLQTLLDEKIRHAREVSDIKTGYESKIKDLLDSVVNKNFERVEALRLEYKTDSNKATQDALIAQKELNKQSNESIILITNKNEALFTKLIDALNNTMNVGFNNIRETIGDLKNTQNRDTGAKEGVKDFRDWIPWIITIAMFLYFVYTRK